TALGKHRVTFQTFADHDDPTLRPTILHGPLRAHQARLEAMNEAGHGIFIMVNDGDLQGRTAKNVTGITAYFIDLDGNPLPADWPLEPTIIVESSPARYHAYWRVTDGLRETFPHVQKHLAVL